MIQDPINDFQLHLSEYLKKCDIIKTCTFTKHDSQCTSDGEFSSFVKCKVAGNCPEETNECCIKRSSVCNTVEKELDNLISESRVHEWNLLISKYVLKESRICLHLDRQHTFSLGIETVNKLGKCYGFYNSYKFKMHPLQDSFSDANSSLTQLRIKLAWDVLKTLLSIGNENDSNHEESDTDLTTLTIVTATSFTKNSIYVGPVMNRQTSARETIYTRKMYYRLRQEDMEALGDHKESSEEMIQDLLNAVVSFDLLSTKLDRPVILDFSKGSKASRDLKNRGAPFVLYNYARLNTILHHFEKKQNEKIYPPLPPLGDLHKLLVEEEEWRLMFNFILSWPDVVRNSFHEQHPKIHLLYSFLSSLALSFSVYYHRHRVLTEPLPHLLPLVFARIHLLKTVETIFINAFRVLNIKPLPFM